jgi:hypothetical protein
VIRRLERHRLSSDLAAVEGLLKDAPADDVVGRMSLEYRREEVAKQLTALSEVSESQAHAALFFGGEPVVGSEGIDADFAAKALGQYEDLVTKVWATANFGPLRKSGPVPYKQAARLHITGTMHGSFGFELAELGEPSQSDTIHLRQAVDDASLAIIAATESDDALADAAASLDDRSFGALRDFLGQLRKSHATLRIVSGEIERSLTLEAIELGAERTQASQIKEEEFSWSGRFSAVLPEARRFEFRRVDGKVLTGRVSDELTLNDLYEMNERFGGQDSVADFHVVTLSRSGSPYSRYVLLNLHELSESGAG